MDLKMSNYKFSLFIKINKSKYIYRILFFSKEKIYTAVNY